MSAPAVDEDARFTKVLDFMVDRMFGGDDDRFWHVIDLVAEKTDELGGDEAYVAWARGIAGQFVDEPDGLAAFLFGIRAVAREEAGLSVTE